MERFTPSTEVRERILKTIAASERRRARIYLAAALAAGLASLAGLVLAVNVIVQAVSQSGFGQYLSLGVSDPDVVIRYWREFVLSLAESAPVIGLAVSLAAVAALLAAGWAAVMGQERRLGLAFDN